MNTLRDVRLWHWRRVITCRARAHNFEALADLWEKQNPGKVSRYRRTQARAAHKEANNHLGAVQALNVCFPLGDYAEQDAAREDAAKLKASGLLADFRPHPPDPVDP